MQKTTTTDGLHATGQQTNSPGTLRDERHFRERLGNIGERKFKYMRAEGLIPDPLVLGPRLHRWTDADIDAVIERLPRAAKPQSDPEPPTLAAGRRRRIEAIKSGQAAGAAL